MSSKPADHTLREDITDYIMDTLWSSKCSQSLLISPTYLSNQNQSIYGHLNLQEIQPHLHANFHPSPPPHLYCVQFFWRELLRCVRQHTAHQCIEGSPAPWNYPWNFQTLHSPEDF